MEGKALDTKSTHKSNAQLSEKYLPLWKINVQNVYSTSDWQNDPFFHWLFWIQSNIIFKWWKNSNNNNNNKKNE